MKTKYVPMKRLVLCLFLILLCFGCVTKKRYERDLLQKDIAYARLRDSLSDEVNKARIEGKEKEKSRIIKILLVDNRFRCIPKSSRDSFITADLAMRKAMYVSWKESLVHLRDQLSDWPLIDSLVKATDNFRIISIVEADTLGIFPDNDLYDTTGLAMKIASLPLSIIPMKEDEYLLRFGKDFCHAAYYEAETRLIVFRTDHSSQELTVSYKKAILFMHELCHDYLWRKGYTLTPSTGDMEKDQHVWIDSITREANRRFLSSFKDTTLDELEKYFIFSNNQDYFRYVQVRQEYKDVVAKISNLALLPPTPERKKELQRMRKRRDELMRELMTDYRVWFQTIP